MAPQRQKQDLADPVVEKRMVLPTAKYILEIARYWSFSTELALCVDCHSRPNAVIGHDI